MPSGKILAAITLFFCFGAGCLAPSLKQNNPVGKIYENRIELHRKYVPLPEGQWKVIGSGNSGDKYGSGDEYFEVHLLKVTEKNEMDTIIFIRSDTPRNTYRGYTANTYPKRTDIHFVKVNSNTEGHPQDWWIINHIRFFINPEGESYRQAHEYIVQNKVYVPKIAILRLHQFTGNVQKSKCVSVEYIFNPEVEGFAPSEDSNWSTCDWNHMKIKDFPDKVAYIEKIRKEGEAVHEKLRESFRP